MPDDTRKSSTTSSTSSKPSAPALRELLPAGESGDPAVHKLLADYETARSNGDADGMKAVRDALAALGYSAA